MTTIISQNIKWTTVMSSYEFGILSADITICLV